MINCIIKKILFTIGIILLIFSAARLGITIKRGFSSGELLANFPMYSVMERYNPVLFNSVKSTESVWFTSGSICNVEDIECKEVPGEWFYGPFHHLVHLPLTLFHSTLKSFTNSLLIIYVLASLFILYFFSRYYFISHNKLFTVFIFALTFGQFAFLENLKQRNIEIAEFLLIFLALLAMKFKKEWLLGISLSLAFLAKLLPLIFFPYLIIKKRYVSVTIYLILVMVIAIITELVLGWGNWVLPKLATSHGIPSLASILGEHYLTGISHLRGSFYTFVLSFFTDIHLTSTSTIVTYKEKYFGLVNSGFFVFCALISFISIRNIYFNKNDTFFDFAIITSLMLLIFPRINPHYYIFFLFGIYYILHIFLCGRQDIINMKTSYKLLIIFLFVTILLLFGYFVPFSVIDKIINQDFPYFHFMAAYGIQGLATFLLWLLLIIIGPEKYNSESL